MTNLLTVAEDEPEVPKENEKWSLFKSYVKNEVEYYKKLSWYWKIIYWIEAPMTILRNATIPSVNGGAFNNKFILLLTSLVFLCSCSTSQRKPGRIACLECPVG